MKLTECKPGTFVQRRENVMTLPSPNVGQIMPGISCNFHKEPVVKVMWAGSGDVVDDIHPGNLEPYSGGFG